MSTDRPRRKYDSPLREAAAAATEARIVDSAADLFNERGYAGTTIADIARAAEVSVPRVNLSGSKTSLLVAAYWKRVGGHPDTEMVTDTDLMRELMSLPTDDALHAYAEWIHATHQKSAGLWFALRAAATADEEAARMLDAIAERNRRDCDVAVAWAQHRGLLTGDVSLTERAEVWGLLGCAETWHRMITMMGWTKERYAAWLLRTLRVTVFDLA